MTFDASHRAFLLPFAYLKEYFHMQMPCELYACVCVCKLEMCVRTHWIFALKRTCHSRVFVCVFLNFLVAFARCQVHFCVKANELRCWKLAPIQKENANVGVYIKQLNENWRRNKTKRVVKVLSESHICLRSFTNAKHMQIIYSGKQVCEYYVVKLLTE